MPIGWIWLLSGWIFLAVDLFISEDMRQHLPGNTTAQFNYLEETTLIGKEERKGLYGLSPSLS